ncbi:class II fructose-bisphosphate aldolase [Promicromonospora thailandica]|uniref:Fructose-bisphosphate aldolase, class II n=1 Tax=Promicromonospora thailandica TaxID=765201 RepID=A0A9X2GDC6_9MICO|nr:class II fructose-bisphosphate aldolase [Promicromonospora thailandica]MCP2266526.1 fructose-bisphosphate aldolase, class II [Promicromonospora thailandica]BFF17403.1 class II fructose-bisphosphate aldolase family protein [Promicromonospora thailandica]
MTLARTGDLVGGTGAVLAFNVITLEHAEGIADGLSAAGVPGILQVSENAVRFHGGRMAALVAACREVAAAADVPVSVHLDHVQDLALARQVVAEAGRLDISSLMVDAAHLPYEENVATTAELAAAGHAQGLWVEAELGEIGGKDGAHAPGVRTDPDEAASFVERTGVDGLAVAVGSSHAMTTATARLDHDLIARLAERLPVPLVLHGSSGVPVDGLRAAVAAGIRKINVGTALNVGYTAQVRSYLAGDDKVTDPRKYLAGARDAVRDTVRDLAGALA